MLTNNQYSHERDNVYFSKVDFFIQQVMSLSYYTIIDILSVLEPILIYLQNDISSINSLPLLTQIVNETNNEEIISYYTMLCNRN